MQGSGRGEGKESQLLLPQHVASAIDESHGPMLILLITLILCTRIPTQPAHPLLPFVSYASSPTTTTHPTFEDPTCHIDPLPSN